MLWTLNNEDCRQPPRTISLKVAALPRTPTADQAPIPRGSLPNKAEATIKSREATSRPGSSYPALRTSTLDVDANPVYESKGKTITEIDMDSGVLSNIIVRKVFHG
jgi:pre-mRNA 3'-end-processing factor FIP1